MQSDVLFDKNAILKDRWASLQIGDKIENSYHLFSDDSETFICVTHGSKCR